MSPFNGCEQALTYLHIHAEPVFERAVRACPKVEMLLNGADMDFEIACKVCSSDGRVPALIELIAEREKLLKQTSELAMTDPLTGLLSGHGFKQELDKVWSLRARNQINADKQGEVLPQRAGWVMMADLDFLKKFNDNYGHLAGDQALVNWSQAISKGTRGVDLINRYGGEEILIFLLDTDGALVDPEKVFDRIRDIVADNPVQINGVTKKIKFSAGAAPLDWEDIHQLAEIGPERFRDALGENLAVQKADELLYQAKEAGRDQIKVPREVSWSVS